MNAWLLGAALATLGCAAIHAFVGGPEVARPIAASGLARVPRFTALYAWHMVTVVLVAMAVAFGAAARSEAHRSAATLAAALAVAFALLNLTLAIHLRARVRELPQWILFSLIAGLAVRGLSR
ncbi:hypothetical protein SAMN02745121_04645 [Nannocystis exedens]|uniref:DUF423 domain-containing protein n=1 Tax=Nannocystis exedens TaxID=54 RepID=A0A1I2BHD5_9BACT|nr:hypothetical protein [Nannocystis exedens]PCC68012.1 hypothetical protein NAEX_01020 [Nannocystis exedens]SFE54683.1 hypothetical protein SAMN02745121_04645 [Nannocystis exedens]